VTPDGQRFLLLEYSGGSQPVIRVVQNWYSEFAEHAAGQMMSNADGARSARLFSQLQ
jgi:hypothetical protein